MLWIYIDKNAQTSIVHQLCEQLRLKILKGDLKPGDMLPPSRVLAKQLNISRNSVIYSYEQLIAEQFLEARKGSGTSVARGAYLEQYKDYVKYEAAQKSNNDVKSNQDVIDFKDGIPDLKNLPQKSWAKLLREVCLDASEADYDYGDPFGNMELRSAISKFVLKTKGIRCSAEQVVILGGSAEGFSIIANALDLQNKGIIVEDPCYCGIKTIFDQFNVRFNAMPVDSKGIQTQFLSRSDKSKLMVITPSHHYPLGGVLPIQRRIQLIQYARKNDVYIIENDYDYEFRYSGPALQSLHLLDPDYVIHLATFSLTLFPSLRLGYMILPEKLLSKCYEIMRANSIQTSTLKQLALSRFINEGHIDRHISKMRKNYYKKQQLLIDRLTQAFGNTIKIYGASTGMYIVVEFKDILFSEKLVEILLKNGIKIELVENHTFKKGIHQNKVIMGYGNLQLDKIEKGVERLQKCLNAIK